MKKNFQNFGPKEGGSADFQKIKNFKILDPKRDKMELILILPRESRQGYLNHYFPIKISKPILNLRA